MEKNKHIYNLQLTEKQAKLLSYACDRLSRIICGQDWTFQEFMEEAWEKRCKKATGNFMDTEWDGGWRNMRHEAEELCKKIKRRFWGCDANVLNGIHYDDEADILYDIHRVLRHQFYKDRGDTSFYTIDSENPTSSIGTEPLAVISKIKNKVE